MKEFNLKKALAGEPVRLRNGSKAFVLKKFDNTKSGRPILIGYFIDECQHENIIYWAESGSYFEKPICPNDLDIIGMWEEPKPTIRIGDIDVPKPETTEPEVDTIFYVPSPACSSGCFQSKWDKDDIDYERLKKGLVHLSKKAAIAHSEALLALTKEAILCTDQC